MNKISLKYVGPVSIILHCSTYSGLVDPNQVIDFEEKVYKKELLKNSNWIKEKTEKTGKKGKK